jgi:hypothetical protein
MNPTDVYLCAIKPTFQSVSSDTVKVSWRSGESIAAQCAGKNVG